MSFSQRDPSEPASDRITTSSDSAAPLQPLSSNTSYTPQTPSTPNTPNPATNVPYYQETSQPAPRSGVHLITQDGYPPNQGYGAFAPMMPQTTTATSHPRPIAPAPVGRRRPPVLRPLPPGGIMAQLGVSSPYRSGSLMQPNLCNKDVRRH